MTILVITQRQMSPQLPHTLLENIYRIVIGSKRIEMQFFILDFSSRIQFSPEKRILNLFNSL